MKTKILLAALALALLASCAWLMPEPGTPASSAAAPTRPPSTADEFLTYMARLRTLDDVALLVETARQRELARKEPSDVARLKAALALSASPQSDEGEILLLVEPALRPGAATDPDAQAMASFLQVMALDRRRLKEGAASANTRSRDDRKAMEAQKHRADGLQDRVGELQQKLDALTTLEQSLSKRARQGK